MAKTALVTGASRGIGKAIAFRLAKDGFQVAVNYAKNMVEAEAVVTQIQKDGGRARAIQADVGKSADVEKLFSETERHLGTIDVLVNNAGVMQPLRIGEASDEAFSAIFDTNVKGVFHTLRLAAKGLNEGGRIINFSTSAIALGMPGYGPYVASKAAVEALSYVFAKELRGRNISCNCVAPGPTNTELFMTGKTPEQVAHLAKLSPLERLGTPEEIANVVSFLSGPDGGWINGQVLRANGGMV